PPRAIAVRLVDVPLKNDSTARTCFATHTGRIRERGSPVPHLRHIGPHVEIRIGCVPPPTGARRNVPRGTPTGPARGPRRSLAVKPRAAWAPRTALHRPMPSANLSLPARADRLPAARD